MISLTQRIRPIYWMIANLYIAIIPHIVRQPLWIILGSIFFGVWRILHDVKGVKLPGRAARILLTYGVMIAVLVQYRTLLGIDPGISLLISVSTLKLLETKNNRDIIVVVFLSCLLVLGETLYDQNVLIAVFAVLSTIMVYNLLIQLNINGNYLKPTRTYMRKSAGFYLRAIPLVALLFLLFPRFDVELWGGFKKNAAGLIGFNDELRPGTIANLLEQDFVAFRSTQLKGPKLSMNNTYWRGAVLWATDGRDWFKGHNNLKEPIVPPEETVTDIVQEVILEPHHNRWLFGLDRILDISGEKGATRDIRNYDAGTFRTIRRIRNRVSYRVVSSLAWQDKQITERQKISALRYPRPLDQKLGKLVANLKRGTKSPEDYISNVYDYFMSNKFSYSFEDLPVNKRWISDFILEYRKGYCEHYASALATLLRMGGIPARIVTGFQGGIYNRFGNYTLVNARDAHAWVEYWSDKSGWTREDPTAVIAPQRINLGGQRYIDFIQSGASNIEALPDSSIGANDFFGAAIFNDLFSVWDSVNSKFNHFLISYDFDFQRYWLDQFGLYKSDLQLVISGLGLALFAIFLFLWWDIKRKTSSNDPILFYYQKLQTHFAKKGLAKEINEGPLNYCIRLQDSKPQKQEPIGTFFEIFINIRYRNLKADKDELKKLRLLLRKIKA